MFHTVWKSSRLSGNLPDCLEIFQTVWKSSRLSGHLPDCPDIFNIFYYRLSFLNGFFEWHFLHLLKNFLDRKNFPSSNATLLPRFFSLCNNGTLITQSYGSQLLGLGLETNWKHICPSENTRTPL